MSIRVKCVCGTRLKAPDSSLGKSVRCSACGAAVFVPKDAVSGTAQIANKEVATWIRFECACGKVIKAPPEWAGKKGHCPRCGVAQVMPAPTPSDGSGEYAAEVREGSVPSPSTEVSRPAVPPVKKQPRAADVDDDVLEGRDHSKSGLIDLTGEEEVKIVDGVAPAVWDAKREQRAKAIKAGPTGQAAYYSRKLAEGPTAENSLFGKTRRWVRTNQSAPIAASLIVIVCASFAVYHSVFAAPTPPAPWPMVYCYDLNAGKIFTAPKTQLSPFATDSGTSPYPQPAGVWAAVFACGNCAEPNERFVGWYEALTTEARTGIGPFIADNPSGEPAEGMLENAISNIEGSVKIATPKNPNAWFTISDPEAATIMNSTPDHCKGTAPTRCRP